MKKIVAEYLFSPQQLNIVRELSEKCGLSELTVKILFSRGVDTFEKIQRFLHPSAENFLSPFLMQGMRELIDAIGDVKKKGGTIAVFGDYDADGIGAVSILSTAMREYGVNTVAYIPERSEGYGLSVDALKKIMDAYTPDLIVTVDCGVSNREEVDYVISRGVRIIVTDHHELPEVLPACTVINPKLKDDYPYDNLCGAGVAFKIACALLGDRAYPLVQLAAISTVADSVPLIGENRDIVAEGLKRINIQPRKAIAYLLAGKKEEITATSLAYTVAPRINAAGRMGDANCALRLFTSEDDAEILELAGKLNEYNTERQQACDEVYCCAKEKIAKEGAFGNVIMLSDESWNTGLVGIVAAKLAEEFNRPVLLFVKRGEMLKGSARTIEGINIYEALKACSAYISEFGGHAQAAGVNILQENFENLKRALDDYIGDRYTPEDFVPSLSICEKNLEADLTLAKELELLEPFGVGNKKPLFSVEAASIQAHPLKLGSPHIAIKAGSLDLVWFGGEKAMPLLSSDLSKEIVFELNVTRFRGKESVRGIVRDMVLSGEGGARTDLYIFRNNLLRLKSEPVSVSKEIVSKEEMLKRIKSACLNCGYGLAVLCTEEIPKEFSDCISGLEKDYFYPFSQNVGNAVIISPSFDADLSQYREIMYLETPSDYNVKGLEGKKIVVNGDKCGYNKIVALETSREILIDIYRRLCGGIAGPDSVAAAYREDTGYTAEQVIFAVEVFCELGLLHFDVNTITVIKGKKTELNKSMLYRAVCALKEKQ